MNWLDILIIVIIAIPTLIGLKNGIIKSVLSLAGVVVGVFLAGRYYAVVAGWLPFIVQANFARIVAFIIILVAIVLTATLIGRMLHWFASLMMLGWLNHLGGAALGFALGAILCGAILAAWAKFIGAEESIAGSGLSRILLDRFPLVLALLPEEFNSIRSFFGK